MSRPGFPLPHREEFDCREKVGMVHWRDWDVVEHVVTGACLREGNGFYSTERLATDGERR